MNNKLSLVPLLLILAITLVIPVGAKAESAITASISAAADELTVGDPIQLTLTVIHPPDYHVILPQLEAKWGEFTVASQSAGTTVSNPDGTASTSQMIDARLFAPGTFTTPSLPISISDSSGQLSEVIAEPLSLTILSVLVEGDNELRDIKPQAELPYRNLLAWIVGIAVLTFGLAGALILWRRHRAKLSLALVDNRLPHEVALDELERIEKLDLPKMGRLKEHYSLVADCIRLYMENIYHIPVIERTTGEIRANMKHSPISQEVAKQFIYFLDESDLVKFSKFTPDVESANQLLAQGRHIVEKTKPAVTEIGIDNNERPSNSISSGPGLGTGGRNQPVEVSA